ncbi:MAG: hypothetical protein K6E43_09240 [Lachnospiraceae bacterium]|nr:hypothetical protein [Lachnospiraceae bacterium]
MYYSSYGDNYTGLRDGGEANWYLYYNGTVNKNCTGLYWDPVYGWWDVYYCVNGHLA